MNPVLIISIVAGYFILLLLISHITSRGADNQSFFIGNRRSPWYIVAIGMVGASLSGVTFISVPGWVLGSKFYYMQMVMGFLLGYSVIAFVLLPVYYRLKLTSIYTYIGLRFGPVSYKTSSSLFLISRIIGASFRLFLVAKVFQMVIFDAYDIPFGLTVIITLGLIWLYTFKGGIKTIVWTDTLQTIFMITAVVLSFVFLSKQMGFNLKEAVNTISDSEFGSMFDFTSWKSKTFFWKQFFAGTFMAIVMTGLDQDMMQKNLSCKSLKDAQKNVISYSFAFVPVNLIFLGLGALLFIFAANNGIEIPSETDDLFPIIATQGYLPTFVGVFFILGLIAAAYSSADSALTSLTTAFLVDILGIRHDDSAKIKQKRFYVHILMSAILAVVIMFFNAFLDKSVIESLYDAATYTYGPLLGLFSLGLFTKRKVSEISVPVIAIICPVIIYIINVNSFEWFAGYEMGFEKLIYNGVLTFLALLIFSKRGSKV